MPCVFVRGKHLAKGAGNASIDFLEGEGGCGDARVVLMQSGSRLSTGQSLGPITVLDDSAKRIEVQAYRDDAAAGSGAFDVTHTESAGPNGPDCEPKVYRLATGGTLQ